MKKPLPAMSREYITKLLIRTWVERFFVHGYRLKCLEPWTPAPYLCLQL